MSTGVDRPRRESRREREPVDPDEEYVVLPPPTRGGRRIVGVAAVVLLLGGLLLGGGVLWAVRQVDPPGDQGALIDSLTIPSGSSSDRIAEILAEEGVITDARLFSMYAGWKDAGPWKAGEYVDFHRDSSFDEAISVLDDGPVPPRTAVVRIPEGKRLLDTLNLIAEQAPQVTVDELGQALASGQVTSKYLPPGSTNWEGLLFPDTYQFEEDADAAEILQTMASQMEDVLDELGYDRAETLQGRTPYELITAASLVEREAGSPPEERGKVARVIYNRLDRGEPLGIDATILYGLGRTSGELTRSDLETESPYNTRKVKGLPPTPISGVGRASLEAAINPPEGEWLYYVLVSNDPSTHLFTDSYEEFQQAKADAQERGVF